LEADTHGLSQGSVTSVSQVMRQTDVNLSIYNIPLPEARTSYLPNTNLYSLIASPTT